MDDVRDLDLRARAVFEMLLLDGLPYLWGGNRPSDGGLDCSGAVLHAFRSAGRELPDMRAKDIHAECKRFIDPDKAFPGDLVFYGKSFIVHVVMVLTPGATAVIGSNGGASFRGVGIEKDMPHQLTENERLRYAHAMERRGARIKIEGKGWTYRSDFRGFGRIPL